MISLLKGWVLSWQFVQDYFNEIYGERIAVQINKERSHIMTAALKDVKATMVDDTEERSKELAAKMIDDLLVSCDLRYVVTFEITNPHTKAGIVKIGGTRVNEGQLANLKAEATALKSMAIWNLLIETPNNLAQNALFKDDGDNKVTHTKGRSMLYLLSTQKKIIETLSSYQSIESHQKPIV